MTAESRTRFFPWPWVPRRLSMLSFGRQFREGRLQHGEVVANDVGPLGVTVENMRWMDQDV